MKKVFICSRYRANEKHTTKDAVDRALFACTQAILKGYAPYAPHLYLPRCLDDSNPHDRLQGMAAELAYAKELGIPIKVFNSIGIPYNYWNSVKFADNSDYIKACEEAGKTL